MDRSTENVLIIHQGALGDLICFLPALSHIRGGFPGAHITVMGYPRILELVERRYYADRVVSVDGAGIASLYQENPKLADRLRIFFGTFGLIGMVGSEKGRFIENLQRTTSGKILAIPPFPPPERALHMVDHLLSLPRGLGIPALPSSPRLYLHQQDRDLALEFLLSHGAGHDRFQIAVHPGSGSFAKSWPRDRFMDLAEALAERYQVPILIVLGPGEEGFKWEFLKGSRNGVLIPVDNLPLPVLGAILERSLVFVGNDSGITHMAGALGTPVVALFGPTDPIRWAPRGERVRLIRKSVRCSPCERDVMRGCGHRICLSEISVGEVYQVVCQLIDECQRPCGSSSRAWARVE